MTDWAQAPMWAEWRRLTRFMWSSRIAFDHEIDRSSLLDPSQIVSVGDAGAGAEFQVPIADHLATLKDSSILFELVLLRSYALMENHCKLLHVICQRRDWSLITRGTDAEEKAEIDGVELSGGIEAWASKLMNDTHQPWIDVYGGQPGLVEISIVRNALMHGYTSASEEMIQAARRRRSTVPFQAGDRIVIGFPLLHEYRGRIRSLCRVLGDGVVHLARGTHRDLSG